MAGWSTLWDKLFFFFFSIHTATPSLEDYEQVSVELKTDVTHLLGKKWIGTNRNHVICLYMLHHPLVRIK